MTLYVCLLLLVFVLIPTLARLCSLCWSHQGPAQSTAAARHTPLQRLLKPRSPRDCPACRLTTTFSSVVGVLATSDIRAKMRKETAHEKLSCHLLDMEMTLIKGTGRGVNGPHFWNGYPK